MSQESQPLKKFLWGSIIIAIIIGIFMIGFISGYTKICNQTFFNTFGCAILIAGASFSGGGFLGFLFGIPSILQTPTAKLKYNDNLVQISDWLTKIIVGVGLTQLYNIPGYIKKVGIQFQINFGAGPWGINVAISIICYFFLLGFLMMYFWTKTDYSTIMKQMDDDLNEQLIQTQLKLEDETQKKVDAQEKVQQTEQLLETNNKNIELKDQELEALSQTYQNTTKSGRSLIEKNNDHQKGKWGGNLESNGRKVSADVRPTTYNKELFVISLQVISTDPNKPLKDKVIFHLHDSFVHPDRIIEVNNGIASLELVAWGSFTVGIECDDGETHLEIDLAQLSDAPKEFREK